MGNRGDCEAWTMTDDRLADFKAYYGHLEEWQDYTGHG